jgi:hypothetical protein
MSIAVKTRLEQLKIQVDRSLRIVINGLIELETGMSCDEGVKLLSDDQVRAIVEKARLQARKPDKK